MSSIASDRINRRACLPGVLGTPMLVLALAGCQFSASADGGLDYEKLEGAITSELNQQYAQISRQVSGVKCPRQATAPKTGDTFTCTAGVDGQTVRVEVIVRDDDYNVHFSTLDTAFDLERTGQSLGPQLSEQYGFPVTVTCGAGLKVVAIGDSFECAAEDADGNTRTVRLTAGSADENDHWEVVD